MSANSRMASRSGGAGLIEVYDEATRAMCRVLESTTIRDVLRGSLADFPELREAQGLEPAPA
jgi:hypothetical protein